MTFDGACMEMIEGSTMLVICDAGPLIHLDELDITPQTKPVGLDSRGVGKHRVI